MLIGVSGSGKTTFGRTHFRPGEVVSSDVCRGLVANDENDQSATLDAFDLLHHLVGIRLRRGLLTVVDATNVQKSSRASLIEVARKHDVLTDAIVLDVPAAIAIERNAARSDRTFGDHVIKRQHHELRSSIRRLRKEGFRRVHHLKGPTDIDVVEVIRERSWNDRTELSGPFDVIGDVHGCAAELATLLIKLGWELEPDHDHPGRFIGGSHPEGRTAVFVGDLVDRGPDTPGVLQMVMGMVEAGTALCVSGNHEAKLVRALRGRDVTIAHGLAESLEQLGAESDEFRDRALTFMDGLISHYVLDDGQLVVAHAGLKEAYHGRTSRRVRAFALYGDTTGETDEFGLPVRMPWAKEYRGAALVAYGHTPVPATEWINNTICLDTGCVFGGHLTALRYPERHVVSVPAEQEWCTPVRPLSKVEDEREPMILQIDDVSGTHWVGTKLAGRIKIPAENSAAALEVMSRFAVDPRWLIHLPATMSPAAATTEGDALEHPQQAFAEYATWGVERVVCEEKHMGSRAIAVLAANAEVAERRFGVTDGTRGAVYTRTGRPFFADHELHRALVDQLREALSPIFGQLDTDWLAVDCELLPWSAKASELIKSQYASVGAAARHALPAAIATLRQAAERGLDVDDLLVRTESRWSNAQAFSDAYAAYCRPTDGLAGVTVAPFALLACEGQALAATHSHMWQMDTLGALQHPFLTPTRHRIVSLDSAEERAAATTWWEELTAAGGEGMVIKPADAAHGSAHPGLKVRGREYLRIIYGPDYTNALAGLRKRNLGTKRRMARQEHALGVESLTDFVEQAPLWKVHQSVFAVLALESEPVDPRL